MGANFNNLIKKESDRTFLSVSFLDNIPIITLDNLQVKNSNIIKDQVSVPN